MDTEARLTRLETITEHMQRDVAEMKVDMRAVREMVHALALRVEAFEGKLSAMEASMIKWMIGTGIALTTAAFTVAKYVN